MTRNETIQTMPSSTREGWRRGAVHLSVALGLGVLLVMLSLLRASDSQARAGLDADAAEDAVSQAALGTHRWLSETLDSGTSVGLGTSLALEPAPPYAPHVSYCDVNNTALKHARWTSSGWLSEMVDNSAAVGQYSSLALEPAAPYTPHISYYDDTSGALKHAWWTPSGWLSETVDNSSASVGAGTSLALEPAAPYTPHIGYRDASNTALKHAWWTPSGWLSETVDNSGTVGWYPSLALESTPPYTPHIGYTGAGYLRHAWWTPSGWLHETVDSSGYVQHISLALESTPPYTPHVSYQHITSVTLKHAWWTPSGWLSETVDSSGSVGWDNSLALEPTAPYAPHISHRDSTNDCLKHAWWTSAGWLSETVDSASGAGWYTSLALEPAAPHHPHISYRAGTLKHAWPHVQLVLFDEAHDERNTLSWSRAQQIEPAYPEWVYFGQLSNALDSEFTLVRNPDAPLTLQLLQGYDALILSAPYAEFTEGEIAAIHLFVSTGGGLIVLGDCGLDHPANAFMPEYEISFDTHCIFGPIPDLEGDFQVAYFASHPAVADGSSFVTNWGQSLQFGSGATYLAWTGTDIWQDSNWNNTYDAGTDLIGPFTIVAGKDTGYGRVAAVSDNAFQDSGFEGRGNAPLMRALLRWVTGGQQRELSFVYLPLALRDEP